MKCRFLPSLGLVAGAALSSLGGVSSAYAYPAFQVHEDAISGTPANTVAADRMSYAYGARIAQTVTGGNGLAGSGDLFREAGYLSLSSYANSSGSVSSYINSPGSAGYQLYATFIINGETDYGQGNNLIHAAFASVSLSLYADVNSNTRLGTTGSTISGGTQVNFTRSNSSDDVLLGSATLALGEANIYNGLASGDFGVSLLLSLNAAGKRLFNVPNDFYPYMHVNGTTSAASNGPALLTGGMSTISGGGTLSFSNTPTAAVPEPGSMLLLGGGLLGLYATSRRRSRKD
ncbi:flocculation-associated PEP-CTERM protein PepA [Azohydromonas lata]|uniref:flocculation-associated PEP-CTERM protein PepA n=1 Tax=Azohydromonas lata TaxID=45677 RepID=UPI0008368744|nr:flocculation-associated PEP-CTERM protein PepA [Azohydromonas lata]